MARFRDVAVPGFALALLGLALGVLTYVLPILGFTLTKDQARLLLYAAILLGVVGLVLIVLWSVSLLLPKKRALAAIKSDAINLSDEIQGFLGTVSSTNPVYEDHSQREWSRFTERVLRHSRGTMDEYSRRFGGRVRALHDELEERGFTDARLDGVYEYPTNPLGIREVAECLRALAQRIPD